MNRNVLLDTGPLVALLNRRDRYHEWAKLQWAKVAPPLLTCEAVLSEACFLLRGAGGQSCGDRIAPPRCRPGGLPYGEPRRESGPLGPQVCRRSHVAGRRLPHPHGGTGTQKRDPDARP